MIHYLIRIEEGPDGRVRFSAKTPPGKATLREMDVAREFQETLSRLNGQHGKFKVTVETPWSDSNNPARQ